MVLQDFLVVSWLIKVTTQSHSTSKLTNLRRSGKLLEPSLSSFKVSANALILMPQTEVIKECSMGIGTPFQGSIDHYS